MQTTHQERARIFRFEIHNLIRQKIAVAGKESKYSTCKGIKIPETEFDTPGNGISIIEVCSDVMIDYRGLHYQYECLPIDELARLADLIKA